MRAAFKRSDVVIAVVIAVFALTGVGVMRFLPYLSLVTGLVYGGF